MKFKQEMRRVETQLCSSEKSQHIAVVYDKTNVYFSELQGPISYASSSKDVFNEQYLLLVVTEKKNQRNIQSSLVSFGGEYVGI